MIPARLGPYLLSLFRIVAGFTYMAHGLQKVFGMFGGTQPPLMSLFGMAGLIETGAGLLIVIGLFTRPAAFLASGQMAAAFFLSHFPRGFWPIENGGELATVYCFAFLYLAAVGAGPWSVDALRKGSR